MSEAEREICALCAWDRDDQNLPEKCWGGNAHLWEITQWADRELSPEEQHAIDMIGEGQDA